MRSRTSDYFEVKYQHEKAQRNGESKKVTEKYVVDAVSWDEAEKKIIEEMSPCASGECQIKSIVPASYHEVFFSDNDEDDKWYKTNLCFAIIDEKSGKEKLSNVNYLVQAKSINGALKNIEEVMSQTMNDYTVLGINETKILDVFESSNA